jgi:LacI family transcriptional regulator
MRDVAKAAGTSVASVSAALHCSRGDTIRISALTCERIRRVAAELGYTANPIAKSLATGRSKVLGLTLPYADAFLDQNPFCNQVMHGVMEEAVHRRYNLMMFTAVAGMSEVQIASLVDSRVDGIVIVMPSAQSELVSRCRSHKIPFVSVLQDRRENLPCVNADDFSGGRLAARHLYNLGHRRIAHLAGSDDVPTTQPRKAGFVQELAELKVPVPDHLIIPSGFNSKSGYDSALRLLRELGRSKFPTAIFAANDLCADGAIRALRDSGMNVPEDVAVVGYDDTWFAQIAQPALTSVHMPIAELGSRAVSMLIDRLEGNPVLDPQPVLPVSLTVRHSCGALGATLSFRTSTSPVLLQ